MVRPELHIVAEDNNKPPRSGALSRQFYAEHTIDVAIELLGKILVHETEHGKCSGRIVETEAYLGENDLACHASRGVTERTRIFWGPPGRAYVFVSYGIHFCLNAITMPVGKAGCVLIRAVEPIEGMDLMIVRRKNSENVTSGPGRLTQAFGITLKNNGDDLTSSSLYILDNKDQIGNIRVSKRVGITKHADAYLRFFIDGNGHVSGNKKYNAQSIPLEEFVKKRAIYLAGIRE